MSKESMNLIWTISMVVMAIASFLLAGEELFDFDLSDSLKRIIGVIDLIAIPAAVWSTIQKSKADQ